MYSGVEVCVLTELTAGLVNRVGSSICVLGDGRRAVSERGSFGGLKSSFGVSSPHRFQWNSNYGQRQVLLDD